LEFRDGVAVTRRLNDFGDLGEAVAKNVSHDN
jgi:hypothetical protein